MSDDVEAILKWHCELEGKRKGDVKEVIMSLIEHLCANSGNLIIDVKSEQFTGPIKVFVRLSPASLTVVEHQITKALEQNKQHQDFQRLKAARDAYKKLQTEYKETYPEAQPSKPIPVMAAKKAPVPAPKKPIPRRETRAMRNAKHAMDFPESVHLDDSNSHEDSDYSSQRDRSASPARKSSSSNDNDGSFVVPDVEGYDDSKEKSSQESNGKDTARVSEPGEQFQKYKGSFMLFAKSSKWIDSKELYLEQWKTNEFLKEAFDLMLKVWCRGQQSPKKTFTKETLWQWIERQFTEPTWHDTKQLEAPFSKGRCAACMTTKPLSYCLIPDATYPKKNVQKFGSCCGRGLEIIFDLLYWLHEMLDEKRLKRDKSRIWWGDFTKRLDDMQTFLTSN